MKITTASFAALLVALWALPLLLATSGCQSTPSYANLVPFPLEPGAANYSTNLLHEGDTVAITFQYSTNFDTVAKIALDGQLNLESVGTVKAAGRTPLELQADLARLYRPQIKDDVVTVKLVGAVASVYVSGAVFRHGKIPMERPLTVLEAVMEAGGFDSTRAKLSDATVLRIQHGKQFTYHLNLKRMLAGRDDNPFYLQPFDIVNVPSRTFNF